MRFPKLRVLRGSGLDELEIEVEDREAGARVPPLYLFIALLLVHRISPKNAGLVTGDAHVILSNSGLGPS